MHHQKHKTLAYASPLIPHAMFASVHLPEFSKSLDVTV
jgi:hypothetical protein